MVKRVENKQSNQKERQGNKKIKAMYEAGKDGEQGEVMGWWGARAPTASLTSGAWRPPSAKDDAPVLDVDVLSALPA